MPLKGVAVGLGRGPQRALRRRVEVARRASERREGEEQAARAEHVLRFFVREDGLEHAVAAHGHVRRCDVRHRRKRDHRDEPCDSRARGEAPGVGDREQTEPEQGRVRDEYRRQQLRPDRGEDEVGRPRDDQHDDRKAQRDPRREQHEPAAARAEVELAGTRREQRERRRDERAAHGATPQVSGSS